MLTKFSEDGLTFEYPKQWEIEREPNEHGWSLSLFSPNTAFITILYDTAMPTLEDVSDSTLQTLQEEYPDLEHEERIESFAGQMSMGHDVQFFSLDLPCTCWFRSVFGPAGSYLVLWQMADDDLETYEDIVRGVCQSMQIEAE